MTGTQTGTVVRPLPGYDDLGRVFQGVESVKRDRDAAAKEQENASIRAAKNRMDFLNREYPLRYKQELGAGRDLLLDRYEELVTKGVDDPFTSTDPASLNFQREFAQWGNKVNFAKQIDTHVSSLDELVRKQQGGYYTDESLADLYGYTKMSLDEAMNSQLPSLQRTNPHTDRYGVVSAMYSSLNSLNPEFQVKDVAPRVAEMFQNTPPDKRDLIDRYEKMYSALPIAERVRMDSGGAANGLTGTMQMMANDVMAMKSPFDEGKFISDVAKLVEPVERSGANEAYSSFSYTDKPKTTERARQVFVDRLESRPSAIMHYRDKLNMPSQPDSEVIDAAFKAKEQAIMAQIKTESKFNKRVSDVKGDDDFEASVGRWSQDVLSGDLKRMNDAAAYIAKQVGTSDNARSGMTEIAGVDPEQYQYIDISVQDKPFPGPKYFAVFRDKFQPGNENNIAREIDPAVLAGELGKNMYGDTYKEVGRHYGSDERGQAAPNIKKGEYD